MLNRALLSIALSKVSPMIAISMFSIVICVKNVAPTKIITMITVSRFAT